MDVKSRPDDKFIFINVMKYCSFQQSNWLYRVINEFDSHKSFPSNNIINTYRKSLVRFPTF